MGFRAGVSGRPTLELSGGFGQWLRGLRHGFFNKGGQRIRLF